MIVIEQNSPGTLLQRITTISWQTPTLSILLYMSIKHVNWELGSGWLIDESQISASVFSDEVAFVIATTEGVLGKKLNFLLTSRGFGWCDQPYWWIKLEGQQ